MKKIAIRIISMCLIMVMCLQFVPMKANAVNYSGSSSYKSGKYYTKLKNVSLTGNQRTDIVNIAKSQIGYQEGSSSSQLSGASYGGKNYTEYGRWYGLQDMWCAMFVSWCANLAGVSTSIVPKHCFTPDGLSWFKSRGLAYTRKTVANGGYTPKAGDIIYFKSARNSNSTNHIGIVTGYSNGTVYTIEGNSSSATISTNGGAVVSKSYSISNTYIVYICKPNYKNSSSSGGTGGGSTGSGSSTLYSGKNNWIPDSVQSIVFNPTYYANKYADLKKAFGTDGNKLYQHFLDYGAKEGRQASAMFNVNTYLEKNSDLKKAFGTDYKAAIKHFASNGIKEIRVTAPCVNLGNSFKARINVSTATLNLSLSDSDVISYTPSDADAQIWKFDRQSNGTYKITNTKNGQVLTLAGSSKSAGAKGQIAKSNDSNAQRWYIYESGVSGKYIFRPACSPGIIIGVKGDSASSMAAIQSVNYKNTKGQRFGITKVTQTVTEKPVDLGTNFHAQIGSVHASGKNLSLDNNNVILYGKSKAPAQTWRFSRQSDGSYILINQKNGYVLTVAGNGGNGSNVELAKNTGASGQKWFIYEKNGKYSIRPACATGCALNLQGSATADLTNIQIATKGDSNAQLFTITRAVFFDLMDPVDVGTDFIANIKNVNAGMNLSLNDNNVIIFTPSDAAAQKFKFERQSDGSYKIINQQNGYVLEAASNAKGANVQVAKSDNSKEQRWFIYVREGHYIFRPVSSDYVLKTLDGGTELRTRLDINNLSTTKVPLFDITNITSVTDVKVTYTVASPYNTKSVGTYATLDEAKSVANSKVHYGYVVFDSTGKFVYTPATSLTASKIIWKAKEDADYIRDKGWTYGDAKKNPYLDKSEKVVSCDRFVGWVLGDVGFTSGQPSTAGLNLVALEQFMINNGFTKITDVTKIEAGDIVYVGHFSAPGTASYNIPRHVFISASSYKSGNGTTYRYDAGSNSRIQSTQPSREPLVHEGDVFRYAYRAPASINNSGGSTNPNTLVIPDAIKTLVFDATYYSNAHADLKNAFGTDAAKLYQHFLDYGIKEGRRAHPTFDIKCYLSENPDLKSAFGTDYVKGMQHYIDFGHKEIRVTAPNVDLGHNFVAKIGSVHASGKNLSLDDNNVILYGSSKAPAQAWRFSRQSDGSYIIVNQKTGLVLTAAGNGGSGANVELTKNAKAANQKWFIYAMNDKYSLRPACSTGCALNLQGSATADLTNIQVASKNNVASQLFTITKGSYFDLVQPADVGTGFTANIKNVKSGLNLSLDDNNVIIYTPSDAAAQKYTFERQSDGSYKLINQKNGYVLEVASSASGANVQIAESDNTSDQRWFIYVKEGHYIFRPASSKNYVLKTCDDGTDPLTRLNIKSLSHNGVPQFDINHCQASSPSSGSGNAYATAEQMAVLRKIMYAVETGGQVYGNARYDDFTEAYTNTPEEHAITIGAGQWYGPEAKKLLNTIRSKYPSTFASLDTAGIASDLDSKDWSSYKLSASSAKAKCIVKIINTPEGRAVQDQLIDEQMAQYLEEARNLGVTEIKAMMMCANIRHLGGLGAVKRVLGKTATPYTLDHIYEALQTDTGNQVGTFKSRNKKVYNWLLEYIG